jgi:DNA invertase Pin-like site-specific DNA recombinase
MKTHQTRPSGDITNRPYAIGYVRVSTEQQAESGLGLEAQRASITAAAARLGLELRRVYEDAAISGSLSIAQRPILMLAVSSLRRGDVLLVAKRDRLARSMFAVMVIEQDIEKHGARIVSAAGEGTDNDNPDSVFFRGIIDLAAQYERSIGRARTKNALAAKRAKGDRSGELPFGFQLAADADRVHARGCHTHGISVASCPCGGRVVQLEPAPIEQRIVARIDELHAEGYTVRQIADDLNRHGWTTRKGTAWRFEYVARTLRRTVGSSV